MGPTSMARSKGNPKAPRAIIHKRILESAEEQPQASVQELASDIAGASADLVEQVLDEYGDPTPNVDETEAAEEDAEVETSDSESTSPEEIDENSPTLESLSEKQRETLRAIRGRLSATQEELGDVLGVSGAAVSNRLSDVEGFDWEDRADFVDDLFGARVMGDGQGQATAEGSAMLEDRLKELDARLQSIEATEGAGGLQPDLTHKVIHAVMDSEEFSEDEELQVIKALV